MKGVNPMIATVILIALAVSIGSLIISWSTQLTKRVTDTSSGKTSEIINCNVADISINDVYLDFNNNIGSIHVRNSGRTDDLTIVSGNIYNTQGDGCKNLTAFPVSDFDKGEIASLKFDITGNITECGNFSKAVVSTNCGQDEFTGTPSNC